jgi:hypothetical protein
MLCTSQTAQKENVLRCGERDAFLDSLLRYVEMSANLLSVLSAASRLNYVWRQKARGGQAVIPDNCAERSEIKMLTSTKERSWFQSKRAARTSSLIDMTPKD